MAQAISVKNFAPSARVLIRPMLLASLGLHGLLLLLPTPDHHKSAPAKAKAEKTVKITQLPPAAKKSKATVIQSAKKPAPRTSVASLPVVRPAIARSTQAQTVIPSITQPKPVTQPRLAEPASTPSQAPPSPTSSPTPVAETETTVSTNPLEDFPHFPGAKAGCLDVPSCFQTGNPLAKVAAYFEQQLPANQYEQRLEIDEPGRKVYQFSKAGLTQYLSLIEIGDTGTVYVLADGPRNLDELKKAVEIPAELGNVLAQLVPTTGNGGINGEELTNDPNATPNDFMEPQLFYESLGGTDADGFEINPVPNSEIYGDLKIIRGQTPPQTLTSILEPTLQGNGFTVSATPMGEYGGGSLYQIQKGRFIGYLNLLPTKDGSGTVVIIWTRSPIQ